LLYRIDNRIHAYSTRTAPFRASALLIDSHPQHTWLARAVEKRLREEVIKLKVEINEEKSKNVDLANGGSFTFLGFEYRRILGRNGKWRPYYAPKMKKRTALLAKLKEILRQNVSQPVEGVIEQVNSILRGWVHYFAVGDSRECFSFVRNWVEKKIRRHLMRARERSGLGWKRWSRKWLSRGNGEQQIDRTYGVWRLPSTQPSEFMVSAPERYATGLPN
jgi:RNA-directed DNA polymerase